MDPSCTSPFPFPVCDAQHEKFGRVALFQFRPFRPQLYGGGNTKKRNKSLKGYIHLTTYIVVQLTTYTYHHNIDHYYLQGCLQAACTSRVMYPLYCLLLQYCLSTYYRPHRPPSLITSLRQSSNYLPLVLCRNHARDALEKLSMHSYSMQCQITFVQSIHCQEPCGSSMDKYGQVWASMGESLL